MPRQARRLVVLPHYPHHIVLRGNNRRRLFSREPEYRFFLSRLLRASRRFGVAVHSSVQMSNHVHLIVTPPGHEKLSKFVRCFAQPYAQFRNRRRSSSGKLFEERFKCIPIENERQMAVTTAYVELNPVRANLCETAHRYRWSTFPRHAGLESCEPLINRVWVPSSWYLSLGANPLERSGAFVDCFEHYRKRDDWTQVYGDPPSRPDQKRVERPDRRRAS
jgi:putative transposase